ncbi:hypothetical protein PVE_R2G0505 [Pseudomonas veronii 1YdBTEX2]|uniref:Uncharacterized protein n=1 Tax=Pseudomonas veronii 1YdBTEX2 TaxID=1295141 RepID=A0A1D3K8M0_PSEVE|nr:hypothetical protein PVE_R2G0505 [Pseudomonas veronii 1YdBTEX2]
MTVNVSLLLRAHGISVLTGQRRLTALVELGQPLEMVDQDGRNFVLQLKDGKLNYSEASMGQCQPIPVRRTLIEPVIITTTGGEKMELRPIPMDRIPSEDPTEWLSFVGIQVPEAELNEIEQRRLQNFMKLHHAEAVTDGTSLFTLAGDGLAFCTPPQH